MRVFTPWALIFCLGLASCDRGSSSEGSPALTVSASATPSAQPAQAQLARRVPPRREGQTLVLAESEEALYLADEDHSRLRRIALTAALTTPPPLPPPAPTPFGVPSKQDVPTPVDVDSGQSSVELPGRPAQVLSLGDRLLVTIRDPGLVVVLRAGSMTEMGRVSVAADAWGMAISPDGHDVYVTSAWTRTLTRLDVSADIPRVVWSTQIAREPRGVSVALDGSHVYVTHLMGAPITRVDVAGEPKVTRLDLPPDPLETLSGEKLTASLGYAAVLSPDGRRLFTARHALGAFWAWQGRTTVDVLDTGKDVPVAPIRQGKPFGTFNSEEHTRLGWMTDRSGVRAEGDGAGWVQPRAMLYRKKTGHLLVASEGLARVAELDAMSMSPGLITNRLYRLGGVITDSLPKMKISPRCGAPSGMALSRDEDVLWVHCRTTDNVVAVRLTPDGKRARRDEIQYIEGGAEHEQPSAFGPFAYANLEVPAADPELALGRRLYFDAEDPIVSGGMACAGCHPDGRDDGHVWREQKTASGEKGDFRFLAGPSLSFDAEKPKEQLYGAPRQTATLAGRVDAPGPYGWHGESLGLVDRVRAGFGLHRADLLRADGQTIRMRADPLARFLRQGLVPPPQPTRALTEEEERGKQVFASQETRCATCHIPTKNFADGNVTALRGFPTLPLFTADDNPGYKVPSLRFVSGTEPYYHDGSAATLTDLVEKNQDRMGKTSHLSPADRTALAAYLRTL